ncbi:MAG: LUD domain-containing protein [Alphaproteobacteria bacterium]
MSQQRIAILSRIRASLGARGIIPEEHAVEARLTARARNLIPARGQLAGGALVTQFMQFAVKTQASIATVSSAQDVPGAIGGYLTAGGLSGPVRLSGDGWLAAMPWDAIAHFNPCTGAVLETDGAGVSVALCGIAETATLMLTSGADAASGLNFLPPTHIIVLRAMDIVGALEDGWGRLRQAGNGQMPRTVNLITGPSRTADIAQTMYMGAHGPKRLHVIVVEGDA